MSLDKSVLQVKEFYNTYNDKFLSVYGNVIQAFRTNNVEDYLEYTFNSIGFKPEELVLDAGCGVCGPAAYFANKIDNLRIEACTISEAQFDVGKKILSDNNLNGQVNLLLHDYNQLEDKFPSESFNRIYFLESFGHSRNQNALVNSCWNLLKEGGVLYIKDLFRREFNDDWKQLRADEIVESINRAYSYSVPELNSLLTSLRKLGFLVEFIKMPDIDKNDFERLSISNEFQELFGVDKIKSWKNYIFPIDFFEVKVVKPEKFDTNSHLYFLNK